MGRLVRSDALFLAGLLLGAIIRLAALPLPGTSDVAAFKVWTYAAATGPVATMYGVGGSPPERRVHAFDGGGTTVDYPPVALYELAAVGRVYQALFPEFPNTPALTAAIKFFAVAAEAGIAWVLFLAIRLIAPDRPQDARYAALAYWLNPAALLTTSVLGYLDPLSTLPVLASLMAASRGRPALSGGLFAVAILTKPQALLLAPVVALLIWNVGRTTARRWPVTALAAGAAGAAGTGAAAVMPVVLAGAWPNFLQAMASLGRHDMLSGQAANVWWIVTYVMRAAYAAAEMGVSGAFLAPVRRPLAISRVVELGYPSPRAAATLLVLAAAGWALWMGRRITDLPRMALVGAWVVFAYFMVAVQVHENHFFMAVPLLALAAAARPSWRPLVWWLSASFALNLNLFYGLGNGIGLAVPRTLTILDATVWLSLANIALLVWFARRLRAELLPSSAVAT